MSESVGMMTVIDRDLQANASAQVLGLVDDEVRRIAETAYADIVALIRDERDRLDALVEELLVHETLDANEAYSAAGLVRPVPDVREQHPPLTVQERVSLEEG
jgi:cell division protease FtsH